MRKALFYFLIVPILCACLAACGDASHRTTNPHAVPIVLTMQDQPPAGLTIESFVVQVTGVSMTGTAGQANVSLLPSPVTVNLSSLATSNTLLANTSAPAGTYAGITITFASPQLTVLNNSGTTFTDGTNSCPSSTTTTSPCTLTPALSQMSVTITNSPFPLSLVSGTPIHMAIDFNTASSLTNTTGTLSITPSVTVTVTSTTNATTNNIADFTNSTGEVTSTSNNQLVVTDMSTGESLTLVPTTNTTFTGFNTSATCTTANTFPCLQTGQIVNFNFGISGAVGSQPTLESVNLNSGITNGVNGTVIAVNPQTNQLEVLITSESPAFQSQASGVKVGQVVFVNPSQNAVFTAQTNGATLPAGLTFGMIGDVAVGQAVLLNSTGFTAGTGGAPGSVTSDSVVLGRSQFTGTISAINSTNQSFVMNSLNGLFVQNAITSVAVDTGTNTTFSGVSGFTGLATGNTLIVGGLLFNTPTGPVLVANQVVVTQTSAAAVRASLNRMLLEGLLDPRAGMIV
jgi:hypothetical protein